MQAREIAVRSINEQLHALWLAGRGMDAAAVKSVFKKRVRVEQQEVAKGGKTRASNELTPILLCLFSVMLVMMPSLIWGMELMRSIIEEKNQRIVEILISSLTPFELLLGKVLGIGAVGLVQYAIWGLFGIGFGWQGASLLASLPPEQKFDLPSGWTFAAFAAFFLLGYFLYSSFFAIVGSMCRNEQEVQQVLFPVIAPLILPLILFPYILRQPDSTLSVVLSLIPLFSPIVMFGRIAVLMPPLWQIALSIVLLLLAIVGAAWVAGRVYRVGILATGRRPSLAELWRWFREG
jgi:ABC-2 type transport system permease protein